MLNVLIVDDEPIIREGLKSIINWENYGFSVCGEAENAEDGIKKILSLAPDLAIVDIRMPFMNGLQMVEELRKQKNNCRIIFLTAYSDFSYAQKAVELGIESYILKPIEEDELIEKLSKLQDTILNDNDKQQFIDESIELSKDRILECLVYDRFNAGLTEKCNKLYGFAFPWKSYHIALIDFTSAQNDSKHNILISLKHKVKKVVEELIQKNDYGFNFEINEYIGILLKNIYTKRFSHILTDIRQEILKKCDIECIISLGTGAENIEDIYKSYNCACELIHKKFIYGHKKIIMDLPDCSVPEKCKEVKTPFDLEKITDKLYGAVDMNNTDYINNILEEIKYNFIYNNYSEEAIKINYTNLYTALMNKIESSNISAAEYIPDIEKTLNDICRYTSLHELHGYIKYNISSISDELAKSRPGNSIEKILDYINRNFNRNIRLEAIASLYNYNSAYLGTVFKNHCGMAFNKYLDLVRMRNAKRLLKEGEKIANVAERSGYNDIDYFYKKFKKYEGICPSEYKKQYKRKKYLS